MLCATKSPSHRRVLVVEPRLPHLCLIRGPINHDREHARALEHVLLQQRLLLRVALLLEPLLMSPHVEVRGQGPPDDRIREAWSTWYSKGRSCFSSKGFVQSSAS